MRIDLSRFHRHWSGQLRSRDGNRVDDQLINLVLLFATAFIADTSVAHRETGREGLVMAARASRTPSFVDRAINGPVEVY